MVQLKLKWGKEEFDVPIEDGTTVEVFKTQVWTLTQVPMERQKYLGFPGGMLKDTDNFMDKVAKMKAGAKVTMLGTAEGNELKAPTEKTVFEEDLTPQEKAKILKEKKVEVPPAGIKNLINTCYMNATLQCLNRVPELRTALDNFQLGADRSLDNVLTAQLGQVFQKLQQTTDSIDPISFLIPLKQKFPKFAEMQGNVPMQQDADECLRGLMQVLSTTLVTSSGNAVDDLFSFRVKSKLRNLECDEEPPSENSEQSRVLMCHLGTPTEPVSHIHQGVQLSMKEHIEKNSVMLGRNAQYEKTQAMDSLSPYLVVTFARFGFKAANEWAGTSANKVKLTRPCKFSSNFDVFDCCTDELKKKLSVGRLKKKDIEDAEVEKLRKERLGKSQSSSSGAKPGEEKKDKDGDVEMKAEDAVGDVDMAGTLEEHDTGYYELVAIVSHKGRTADGGHYVGWTKHKKADGKDYKEDQWILFDDSSVYFQDWKDMVGLATDLQGGKADTQISYINIYKKVTVRDQGKVLGSASDEKKDEKKEEAKA